MDMSRLEKVYSLGCCLVFYEEESSESPSRKTQNATHVFSREKQDLSPDGMCPTENRLPAKKKNNMERRNESAKRRQLRQCVTISRASKITFLNIFRWFAGSRPPTMPAEKRETVARRGRLAQLSQEL